MSRRNISPIKGRSVLDSAAPGLLPPGIDERQLIIKKLKQELILARSKQKEVVILENYTIQLKQKIRALTEDIKRKQNDIKNKAQMSQKTINDLKRQVEIYKSQLKNFSIQLGQKQATLLELKRHLAKRNTQLQKLKKQTLYLKQDNDRLIVENTGFSNRYQQIQSQLLRIQATNRDYLAVISQRSSKIGQVKAYIGQLNNQARILKEKLKKHQQQNNNISDDLNNRQQNIDNLEKLFADEHDQIKGQIDNFIQLEHKNEKILTQIRHKINLNKAQNEKANELNIAIQKIDKNINSVNKQNQGVQNQVKQYMDRNNEFNRYNQQLSNDLAKCQAHLQNLMRYNAAIQQQLEKYLREDEQVISIIKRKRAVDLIPLRQSRKLATERTYI